MISPSAEQIQKELREAINQPHFNAATWWVPDLLKRTLTLLASLSQELERVRTEHEALKAEMEKRA